MARRLRFSRTHSRRRSRRDPVAYGNPPLATKPPQRTEIRRKDKADRAKAYTAPHITKKPYFGLVAKLVATDGNPTPPKANKPLDFIG